MRHPRGEQVADDRRPDFAVPERQAVCLPLEARLAVGAAQRIAGGEPDAEHARQRRAVGPEDAAAPVHQRRGGARLGAERDPRPVRLEQRQGAGAVAEGRHDQVGLLQDARRFRVGHRPAEAVQAQARLRSAAAQHPGAAQQVAGVGAEAGEREDAPGLRAHILRAEIRVAFGERRGRARVGQPQRAAMQDGDAAVPEAEARRDVEQQPRAGDGAVRAADDRDLGGRAAGEALHGRRRAGEGQDLGRLDHLAREARQQRRARHDLAFEPLRRLVRPGRQHQRRRFELQLPAFRASGNGAAADAPGAAIRRRAAGGHRLEAGQERIAPGGGEGAAQFLRHLGQEGRRGGQGDGGAAPPQHVLPGRRRERERQRRLPRRFHRAEEALGVAVGADGVVAQLPDADGFAALDDPDRKGEQRVQQTRAPRREEQARAGGAAAHDNRAERRRFGFRENTQLPLRLVSLPERHYHGLHP